MTVYRNGAFDWYGEAFVPVEGERQGKFAPALFRALVRLIEDVGFVDWRDEYVRPIEDLPATIVTVRRGGVDKSVVQSGTDKPEGLQVIATFVDGIVAPRLWNP